MMKLVVVFFYRPLYFFFKWQLLLFKPFLDEKTKKWIDLRQQSLPEFKIEKQSVWLHASSGEIEYLKSFIREHKKNYPEVFIAVSYSSPSAPKLFENIKSSVDIFFPLPWDQPGEIQKILTALNPSSFYFGRTDLWPELIYQLFLRSVRTYILSYNPNLRFLNQLWSRIFLKNFSGLFCTHVSQEDMLKKILPDSVLIKTPGDTRYDQVFWRLRQPTKIPFQILSEYFVLGSTWPEDESVILPALKEIKNLGYKIILSPHEIDSVNINRLAKLITELNLSCEKFSELNSVDAEVILVDKVGYLADFYRDCSGAFIGGSFKSKVHSVMEPLCCAVPVITGPKIYNSPEALQYHQVIMNELRVVQSVRTTTEFLNAVKKIKNTNKADFKKLLIGHLEKNRYATQKIMTFIVE